MTPLEILVLISCSWVVIAGLIVAFVIAGSGGEETPPAPEPETKPQP